MVFGAIVQRLCRVSVLFVSRLFVQPPAKWDTGGFKYWIDTDQSRVPLPSREPVDDLPMGSIPALRGESGCVQARRAELGAIARLGNLLTPRNTVELAQRAPHHNRVGALHHP